MKLKKVVCLIQDVVSVIQEWRDVARGLLCRTTLSYRHIIGMRGKHICKQRKQSSCLIFIHSYCVSRIHRHIFIFKDIDSIFQATLWSTFFRKSIVGRLCSDTEYNRTVP